MNTLGKFSILGTLLVLLAYPAYSWATPATGMTSVEDIVQLEHKSAPQVQLSQPINRVGSPLKAQITDVHDLSAEDTSNLASLWQTVIQRNPVIQYGLKQLATPPELRYAHASIMSRTISGLLSGAAMVPYVMGADQMTAGATSISANLVDRAVTQSQKIDPAQLPSDTELVELSGLVQKLQQSLTENYFEYKNSLNNYIQLEQLQDKLKTQMIQAQQTTDPMDDLWSRQLYNTTTTQLLATRENAKRYYLVLERLAGTEGMHHLRFGDMPTEAISPKPTESAGQTPLQSKVAL